MKMISADEAKALISANCAQLPAIKIGLAEAAGLTLAAPVTAPVALPPFNQSSMDGYAIAFDGYVPGQMLSTGRTMQAGSNSLLSLTNGEAIRIFTGAPLPLNADTVVMQEQVTTGNGMISIAVQGLMKGDNVRVKGAEIEAGQVALRAGSVLTPSAIGYLAGMGITEVEVVAKMKVAILITGNELCAPGQQLEFGQVYESSSFALEAALKKLPVTISAVNYVPDDLQQLTLAIAELSAANDLLLITGGASVGDFDFTSEACAQAGVQQIFHSVKQKPGKPLYFGTLGNRLIFGLPGNPSSVLSCFYLYVVPAIEKRCANPSGIHMITAKFSGEYRKKAGLTHFLKGRCAHNLAEQSGAQESYKLSSFATSNCLIQVNEETEFINEGDDVLVYVLN